MNLLNYLKSLPFSRYGSFGRGGGYGRTAYTGWEGEGYGFSALPGTKYDYHEAAGVLWQNPSAAACFVALTKAFAQARPLLEHRETGGWVRVDRHLMVDLLNAPNPFYSGEKMFGVTLISAMAHGAAFWRIERNAAGLPGELWFEPPTGQGPTGIAPNWDETSFIRDYTYFVDGRAYEEPLNREDVVFFRYGLHPANSRLPWSPLRLGAREIATLNSASTYTGALLRNAAVPSGMLTMEKTGANGAPPTPQQAEEIKQKIKAGFRGDNVGEPFVSSTPWKWTPFNWSPSQLSLDKIQQWPQGIVCALLATPAIVALLPTGEQPTYANLDASMRWWWDNTIIPLEDSFADDIETQLFPAFGLNNTDWRIVWDRSQVPALREDEQAKHSMIAADFKAGVIDRDEARVALGYESKPEYRGKFVVQTKAAGGGVEEAIKAREFHELDWVRKGGRFDGYIGSHKPKISRRGNGFVVVSGPVPDGDDEGATHDPTQHESGLNDDDLTAMEQWLNSRDADLVFNPFDALHDWEGDSVPAESPAFQAGKAQLFRDLLPHAKPGQNEAGACVRQSDGSLYHPIEKGDRRSVYIECPDNDVDIPVAQMHSHPVDRNASPSDWVYLLTNKNVMQQHLICPTVTYSFHKPPGQFTTPSSLEVRVKCASIEMSYNRECKKQGKKEDMNELCDIIAREMCKDYGILFRKGLRQMPTGGTM